MTLANSQLNIVDQQVIATLATGVLAGENAQVYQQTIQDCVDFHGGYGNCQGALYAAVFGATAAPFLLPEVIAATAPFAVSAAGATASTIGGATATVGSAVTNAYVQGTITASSLVTALSQSAAGRNVLQNIQELFSVNST